MLRLYKQGDNNLMIIIIQKRRAQGALRWNKLKRAIKL
jgi:hypothetical protein